MKLDNKKNPEGGSENKLKDNEGIAEGIKAQTEDKEEKNEAEQLQDSKESTESSEEKLTDNSRNTEGTEKQEISRRENLDGSEKKETDQRASVANIQDKSERNEGGEENIEEQADKTEDGEKSAEEAGKRSKKKFLIPTGIFLALIFICVCIYSVIAFSYKDKFLPGTWINGIDCAELDASQVAGVMENQLQTYYLDVMGRDYTGNALEMLLGRVTAEDIHLTYSGNSKEAVDDLLAKQNIFTWLYRKLSDDTYSFQLPQRVFYDEEQLKNIVNGWEACRPDNMIAPQDAYISEYSEKQKGYEIIPEVEGSKFDVQMLLQLMDTAILSQETLLDLEAKECYEEPVVRQDASQLTEPVETVNKWLGTKVTYDWNGAEIVVDAELLKDWITMEKDGPVLDETAVSAFVKEQAEENDTYGKRRSFVTTHGVELSLPSGYYGWLTDREAETKELIAAIQQGRTVTREPVYANTARQKGMSDIGNSYVEVDLTHQHLYLYEEGTIIFETDFVSGSMSSTPDCVTPEGVFGISYKTTNAVLRGANYETPVNYWMPFYGNYGLHDATWRSEFGGQIYIENGSHGCVNLPLNSAATIYGHMSAGFPVICYYYQVDPLADQYVEEEWYDNDEEE